MCKLALTLSLALAGCGATPGPLSAESAAPGRADVAEPIAAGPRFATQRPAHRAPDPLSQDANAAVELRVEPSEAANASPDELDAVLSELRYNAGHVQRCWEQRAPHARAGTIGVHAHIDPHGEVEGQCVGEDTVGDAALVQCVNEHIAMGRYPGGRTNNLDVTVSVSFSKPHG